MDLPSILLAAGILCGIVLGSLLTAINAGLLELGAARLRAIAESDSRDAATARRLLKNEHGIRAQVLVGRIACLAVSAGLVVYWARPLADFWELSVALGAIAIAYAAISTATTAAVCQRPRQITFALVRFFYPLEVLLAPFAWPMQWIAKVVESVIPESEDEQSERVAEIAVQEVIENVEGQGSFGVEYVKMLRSVLEFKNTVAREIMVPRTDMVAFEIDTPVPEVMARIRSEGHSRYPIYKDQIDQVVGILYAKDIFAISEKDQSTGDLSKIVRSPAFLTAETAKIGQLLRQMQVKRMHMAVVVDEFGGASGLVTLEDILEEIVGEIQDEYDEELPQVRVRRDGTFTVDAAISIYDLQEQLGHDIGESDGSFDTLGGLIVHVAGKVPVINEIVPLDGYDARIIESDGRRVTRVQLSENRGREEAIASEA
ncbi:MAG: hemolysin family protein [Polyangiales bacterium]